VRREAFAALEKLGRAVEPLIAVLRPFRDKSAQLDAIEALGKLGDARAVEPLIALLSRYHHKSERLKAIEALGRLGDARAVGPLIALSQDEDYDVRRGAFAALSKLGDAGLWAERLAAGKAVPVAAISNLTTLLRAELVRRAPEQRGWMAPDVLRGLARLPNAAVLKWVESTESCGGPDPTHSRWEEEQTDCAYIRQLARQALIRRGLSVTTPTPTPVSEFDAILTVVGDNRLQVIKTVRVLKNLDLEEAKKFVDTTPRAVLEKVSQKEAEIAKAELEAVGATLKLDWFDRPTLTPVKRELYVVTAPATSSMRNTPVRPPELPPDTQLGSHAAPTSEERRRAHRAGLEWRCGKHGHVLDPTRSSCPIDGSPADWRAPPEQDQVRI